MLEIVEISKRFGALQANDRISLTLHRGEVLALLGENGAGKSTLMSILFGHYRADAGHIRVAGRPLAPGDPRAAIAAGIGMVHQHFALADNLSVLDNVMLGSEPLWQPFTRRRAARERLRALAGRFGLPVEPDALVRELSVGERQRVEILKALYRDARILMLDEPTAVLTPQESEALFTVLASMVAQGLAVIFISHKLGEVLRVSHRIAVLRAGRLVAQAPASECDPARLARWMVGHEIDEREAGPAGSPGETVCALRGVVTAPDARAGRERLRGLDLVLRAGELVAVAGVSGNGQRHLAELLCGVRAADGGELRLGDEPLRADPAWLVSRGVARVPEDRSAVGLVGELPLWENALAERLRTPEFARGGWVRRAAAREQAERVLRAFDVRGAGAGSSARALSGGNMQKLILGRALMPPPGAPAPRLIVAHQPTWGLDVGAVDFVRGRLLQARDQGAAVLLISDDLDEVLAMGERIAVMHDGRIVGDRSARAWSREAIGLAMAGGGDAARAA